MGKFNIDTFFEILSGKNFDQLIKKMPVLQKPDFFFQYALAKGYGFKGSLYNFSDEAEPFPLKERFKQTDKRLIYKSIVEIEDGDDKGAYGVCIGLLTSKSIENVFLIYNYFTTSTYDYPQVVKVYKKDKVPKTLGIKKDVSNIIKKELFFTPFIKKKLGQKKTWI
tara:strand:+ start:264 stop:761 length:498 start_codon:yes stop_codon:yes gene_type:complete